MFARSVALVLIFAGLGACNTKATQTPTSTTPPAGAPAGSSCVDDCVQQHQMVAVSIEQIRADCNRICAEAAPPAKP
jgi:hypothetical protein